MWKWLSLPSAVFTPVSYTATELGCVSVRNACLFLLHERFWTGRVLCYLAAKSVFFRDGDTALGHVCHEQHGVPLPSFYLGSVLLLEGRWDAARHSEGGAFKENPPDRHLWLQSPSLSMTSRKQGLASALWNALSHHFPPLCACFD